MEGRANHETEGSEGGQGQWGERIKVKGVAKRKGRGRTGRWMDGWMDGWKVGAAEERRGGTGREGRHLVEARKGIRVRIPGRVAHGDVHKLSGLMVQHTSSPGRKHQHQWWTQSLGIRLGRGGGWGRWGQRSLRRLCSHRGSGLQLDGRRAPLSPVVHDGDRVVRDEPCPPGLAEQLGDLVGPVCISHATGSRYDESMATVADEFDGAALADVIMG